MGLKVIWAAEFNSEVVCDLGGHLEATTESKIDKMAGRGKLHRENWVIEVADSICDFNFSFEAMEANLEDEVPQNSASSDSKRSVKSLSMGY